VSTPRHSAYSTHRNPTCTSAVRTSLATNAAAADTNSTTAWLLRPANGASTIPSTANAASWKGSSKVPEVRRPPPLVVPGLGAELVLPHVHQSAGTHRLLDPREHGSADGNTVIA
jgi:hypothetical protein